MRVKPIKLKKSELAEGILPDILAKVDMKRSPSPVIFHPEDEPVNLLQCSKGFWVSLGDEKFLEDEQGKLVVFPTRECTVARARFLSLRFEDEIERETEKIIFARKNKAERMLNNLRDKLEKLKINSSLCSHDTSNFKLSLIKSLTNEENVNLIQKEGGKNAKLYQGMIPVLNRLEKAFEDGQYTPVISTLEGKDYNSLIFRGSLNNPQEMAIITQIFNLKRFEQGIEPERISAEIEARQKWMR